MALLIYRHRVHRVRLKIPHTAVHVPTPPIDDGFQVLFGAPGTEGLAAGQGTANAVSDANLTASNAGLETTLTNNADLFEATAGDHGLEQLINAIDPSSYVVQFTPGIDGTLTTAGDVGGYLVPDDFLGYVGTELDAFLLTPLGLDPALLGPLLDAILGSPGF
jgi:hypothetical protein